MKPLIISRAKQMKKTLNVNEMFVSIQGEGHFAGVPCLFIRLQGCDNGCSFCDTKHSWKSDPKNKTTLQKIINKKKPNSKWMELDVDTILSIAVKLSNRLRHVVVTGGEPCLQDINDLILGLSRIFSTVQIETSGTRDLKAVSRLGVWVTLSPKKKPIKISKVNEVKMVIGNYNDVARLEEIIKQIGSSLYLLPKIFIQPESRSSKANKICYDVSLKTGWRVSIQLHKYLKWT